MPPTTSVTTYAIALGANVRSRHGSPEQTLRSALDTLGEVTMVSPILRTPPLGPSRRRFANAAALVRSDLSPPALLARLKAVERAFGRRPGRHWGARPLDLDIILWSGGAWSDRDLTIPHAACRARTFVLHPLATIIPEWRDPLTGRTVRQLLHLVDRPRPRS